MYSIQNILRVVSVATVAMTSFANTAQATPKAAESTTAPATIETITNLARQDAVETWKTKVLVTRAAGVKAERDAAPPQALQLANPTAALQKKRKEEFMTLPGVTSITGIGTRLKATLSDGRLVVVGDQFAAGPAAFTVETINKSMVVFKRCVKDKCAQVSSPVSGH